MSRPESTPSSPPVSGSRSRQDWDTNRENALSNIRHSLRTPLNQILGYGEILQEEAQERGLEPYLPDLHKLHMAGEQLLGLINDNLASSKIIAGRFDLELFHRDCRSVLNLIVGYTELCLEYAAETSQETVAADLSKIRTAAANLLALLDDAEFLRPLVQITAAAHSPGGLVALARSTAEVTGRVSPEYVSGETAPLVGTVLVVDDNDINRDMLSRRLERQGHTVCVAENGLKALELLEQQKVDLILLDILMPVLDGQQTLERLKTDERSRHVPVIMLSALDEIDRVVHCVELGADDYLPKPFNPVLLRARINACLEKKRLRDQEQAYLQELQSEREKAEKLLLNVLPQSVAERLKSGETRIADSYPDVTVLFADLVDFTQLASSVSPPELVRLLEDVFSRFDWLAELHGLEKIKTIGDAYMAVGGLPHPRPDHARAAAEMALDMRQVVSRLDTQGGVKLNLRIGMNSGPVVAGIIGSKKFIYDLWGDTVNIASRMESQGQLGCIQVSEMTHALLRDHYRFQERGCIEVKGKGSMRTYFLEGRR